MDIEISQPAHSQSGTQEKHLSNLFSDISKSLRSLFLETRPTTSSSSAEEPMSLTSLITGSNCIRTCGMEDIQLAARRAAELCQTLNVCAILLTTFLVLYILLLIGIKVWRLNLCRSSSSTPFGHKFMGSFVGGHNGRRGALSDTGGEGSDCAAKSEQHFGGDDIRQTLAELSAKLSIPVQQHSPQHHQSHISRPAPMNADNEPEERSTAPATPFSGLCPTHNQPPADKRNVVPSNALTFFGQSNLQPQNHGNNDQFASLSDFLMARRMGAAVCPSGVGAESNGRQ